MPIFLFKRSITPDMIVMIPSPPICIKTSITACPNTLQVETVGRVTRPVTQVEVVAVNSASRYGTATPVAELMGKAKRALPSRIVTRKLSNIVCVVDKANSFFLIINNPSKKHKEPTSSTVSWFLNYPFLIIISHYIVSVNVFSRSVNLRSIK